MRKGRSSGGQEVRRSGTSSPEETSSLSACSEESRSARSCCGCLTRMASSPSVRFSAPSRTARVTFTSMRWAFGIRHSAFGIRHSVVRAKQVLRYDRGERRDDTQHKKTRPVVKWSHCQVCERLVALDEGLEHCELKQCTSVSK